MTEQTISPVDKDSASRMILMAMTKESKHSELFEHFNITRTEGKNVEVQVELKINGVSVDFKETLNEAFRRLSSTFETNLKDRTTVSDEVVLAKAKELLSKTRFEKLESILSEAEWKIEMELEQLMKDEK